MPNITLYHNPRCSKSREALKLLKEKAIEPKVVLYLENPPTIKELTELLALLKIRPLELIRTKEVAYQELKLNKLKYSDKELIAIIAKNPILMERPIVIHKQKAVIARPPEKLLEII